MNVLKINAPVVVQHPKDPKNWILTQDFHYGGRVIPRGFVTDFASVPRLVWALISSTDLGDVGPVVHDWKYRNGIGSRSAVDKEFLRNMEREKIAWWKRQLAYRAVRLFGGSSWNTGKVVIETILLPGEVMA